MPKKRQLNSSREKMKKVAIVFLGVFIILVSRETERCLQTCTLGVVNGCVTVDGRPIFWRIDDSSHEKRMRLAHVDASPYDYIGITEVDHYIPSGLNEAGIAGHDTFVGTTGEVAPDGVGAYGITLHSLRNYTSLDQVRDYIKQKVDTDKSNAGGCLGFIDAHGNASIFEINRSNWWFEYNSVNPNRKRQGLFGFVVRANEFHQRANDTDDTNIGGRYQSGTYNILGLCRRGILSVKTIIQGDNVFEVIRYGPGRPLAALAREEQYKPNSVMVVHGVAPGENPALATMWVILGQPNYGIAVPAWVKVSDIPHCLSSGEMCDRAMSLFKKRGGIIVRRSVFPVEAHMFDVVNNTLLPHWRANGVPSVVEMTRIEHRMAADAYSLLSCLDKQDRMNRAPDLTLNVYQENLTANFTVRVNDPDGKIVSIKWDFGDSQISKEKSPSHTYAKPGTYLVSCTVTDDDGVTITDWDYLHFGRLQVKPEPGIEIKQPWFGIEVKVVEFPEEKGRLKTQLLVTKVYKGSPAERVGVREGDTIWPYSGCGIDRTFVEDLERKLRAIVEFKERRELNPFDDMWIKRDKEYIKIPDEEIIRTLEMRKEEEIPSGTY
ncbi:MAG: hypothetical protein CO162_08010 [bacterium (Candidatus Ratteibacteria) CG_4_9_14_3_um_filter_41_21]|uniref:PKD domain-containing protein n=2 Tax=Candidatus Ratteibacteria TaxID=2979319 RepID=A0A2M7YDR1_9BACT|nr:MAG: hypothetical protein COS11_04880 [bacterium (Candidatus Ratteibacteria) CG01_land_8_20_14_3_00_40_19]PJA61115.1 MAG: hypothetical protein CO162_08010 [bacterium (Candidatus Ratteibacteria) CG_4_9_14_3_um_filter_41_21]